MPRKLRVHLNSHVYKACLQHAYSIQTEEVMGLLVGEVLHVLDDDDDDGAKEDITLIEFVGLKIFQRSERKKDRVEISASQLSDGIIYAEKLSVELGRKGLRVIGWYHSHPNITVWPSHVDLRTQKDYQMMDKNFVGVIFSVFDKNSQSKWTQNTVTCFQTTDKMERRDIELTITDTLINNNNMCDEELAIASRFLEKLAKDELIRLPRLLFQEQVEQFQVGAKKNSSQNSGLEDGQTHGSDLNYLQRSAALRLVSHNIVESIALPMMAENRAEVELIKAQNASLKERLETLAAKFK